MTFPIEKIRNDFPILQRQIDDQKLIYLDSAATSLKPIQVYDRIRYFYETCTANVHRAVHQLSEEATDALESSRARVAEFLNVDSREIAFVKNATEALNVIANSLQSERPAVFPLSEHHSNYLPWRQQESTYFRLEKDFTINAEDACKFIADNEPGVVAFSTVSNAIGYHLPVDLLAEASRNVDAAIVVDLSQSVGHEQVDLHALDCDFAVFSGHKMLGPSGVGVLYRREESAPALRPLLLGGEMVHEVHEDSFEPRPYPWSIEAGTPNIEGIMGLAAACDYLDDIGLDEIKKYCSALCEKLYEGLSRIENVKLITPKQDDYPGIIAFSINGIESHGVARILSNRYAIMVRSGYHCAQPFHELSNIGETVRASVHLYNTEEEVDIFVDAIKSIGASLSK